MTTLPHHTSIAITVSKASDFFNYPVLQGLDEEK